MDRNKAIKETLNHLNEIGLKLRPDKDGFYLTRKDVLKYYQRLKRHEKRMELYNKGLIDREIAEELGVSTSAICNWRNKHLLPSNYKLDNKEKIELLYKGGATDKKIAEVVECKSSSVYRWRKKNNLEANSRKSFYDDFAKKFWLWQKGLNDREIGERLGVSTTRINHWREKFRLPAQSKKDKEYLAEK